VSENYDREEQQADEAIERIHTQLSLEGKLDKAYAAEGAAVLTFPLVLLAVLAVAGLLTLIGLDGEAQAVVGALVLVAGLLTGIYLATRQATR
jgi:hypothetical protein